MTALYNNLTPVFQAAITLCVAVLSAFAVPWLRAKLDADKLSALQSWVRIGVAAAEQLAKSRGWNGASKKAAVLDFLREKGYTIELTEIDQAIEAAVLELHNTLYGEALNHG